MKKKMKAYPSVITIDQLSQLCQRLSHDRSVVFVQAYLYAGNAAGWTHLKYGGSMKFSIEDVWSALDWWAGDLESQGADAFYRGVLTIEFFRPDHVMHVIRVLS